MENKVLNVLPVKFQSIGVNKIKIFYRKRNDHNLYNKIVNFQNYYFRKVDKNDHRVKFRDDLYTILGTNEKVERININKWEDIKYKNELDPSFTGEGDLSHETRFIIDTFYDKDFPPDIKPRIFYLDIETYSEDKKIPKFNHNVAFINAITIYDSYTKKYYSYFIIPENKNINETMEYIYNSISEYNIDKSNCNIYFFNNEKELLETFCDFLVNNPPDIITAWNVSFDISYLTRKIYDNFGNEGLKSISIFNRVSSKITYAIEKNYELNDYNVIPGCSIIDMLELYKKISPVKPDSLRLQDIAMKELGEGKVEYSSEDPIQLYVDNFELFCKYNIQDVRLIKEIDDKRKMINLTVTVTNPSKNNYEDYFTEMSLHDHWLLFTAYQWRQEGKKIVLPSKTPKIKRQLTAAYVKPSLVGRHRWLSDIDYSSMYPSNIYSFTISPETKVGKVRNYKEVMLRNAYNYYKINNKDILIKKCIPSYKDSEFVYNKDLKELENTPVNVEYFELYIDNQTNFSNMGEFEDYCRKNNWVILPTGVIFDQKNQLNAILPYLMNKFLSTRSYYKNLKKQAAKDKNEELEQIYDNYQNAFKLLGNSCFTEDHSVLTLDGIKNIKDVEIGTKLLSQNIDINNNSNNIETDTVYSKVEKYYDGFIYHIKNKTINYSATEDHNFIVRDKNLKLHIKTSKELYDELNSDRNCYYTFPSPSNDNTLEYPVINPLCFSDFKYLKKYISKEETCNISYLIEPIEGTIIEWQKILDDNNIDNICSYDSELKKYVIEIKNIFSYLDNKFIREIGYKDKITYNGYFKRKEINVKENEFGDEVEEVNYYYENSGVYFEDFVLYFRNQQKNAVFEFYYMLDAEIEDEFLRNLTYYTSVDNIEKYKDIIMCGFFMDISNNFNEIPIKFINHNTNYYLLNDYLYDIDSIKSKLPFIIRNKENLSVICNMLISMGFSIRVHKINTKNTEPFYEIKYEKDEVKITKEHITRENYKGKVYCINVKNNRNFYCGKDGCFNIVMNCYGSASNEYFRFYDIDLAESITLTGQSLIKTSINLSNKKLNKMIEEKRIKENPDYIHSYIDSVVTSDTDSVIFTLNNLVETDIHNYTENDLKNIFELSKQVQNEVNGKIHDFCSKLFFKNSNSLIIDGEEIKTNIHNAKSEWIALSGIYLAKKMYINHFVYRDELPCDAYVPMGMSLKRSSTPNKLKNFISDVFVSALNYKNKKEINDYVLNEIRNIKTKYSPKDIGLPTGIEDIDYYVKNTPIHVRGAKIYNNYFCESENEYIVSGKVKYLYVKKWKKNNNLNMNGEYVISLPLESKYWDNIEDYIEIDYEKMVERLIEKPLEKLYKILEMELPKFTNKSFSFKSLGKKK